MSKKSFVISDTHFDHANIIKYSKRPFDNVSEMNDILISNWNHIVGNNDDVYFLGDFALGKNHSVFLRELKGNVIFVIGNHDKGLNGLVKLNKFLVKIFDDIELYMCHCPEDIPNRYHGWAICGHHHNNFMDVFPFFNPYNGIINVGVDVTNFRPIDISTITNLINTKKERLLYAP